MASGTIALELDLTPKWKPAHRLLSHIRLREPMSTIKTLLMKVVRLLLAPIRTHSFAPEVAGLVCTGIDNG